ncbi:uncharacterized protein cd5 [Pholidichthys leucotaenia]
MDLRTVAVISALFLLAAGLTGTTQNATTPPECSCPTPDPSTRFIGFLTVQWTGTCDGRVVVAPYFPDNSSLLQVCHTGDQRVQSFLTHLCHNKGCKDLKEQRPSDHDAPGYEVTQRKFTNCKALTITCHEEQSPDGHGCTGGKEKNGDTGEKEEEDQEGERCDQGELKVYKVVTGLLCCVLLILLLLRFTKPTVNALQKRLSDRRQNRWIGPTQSHSVSYHRGKAAVNRNDEEKRSSYPALERLTIPDSREPSSTRNSGCNF